MQYVNAINIMAYDYHVSGEAVTNNNAPLYADKNDPSSHAQDFNVNAAVQYYLAHGATANKLILGVPLYGYGWNATTAGPEGDGLYTSGTGIAGSIPVKTILSTYLAGNYNNPNVKWNDSSKFAVFFDGKHFISFETPQSIVAKAAYIKANNLGGVMYWSADNDSCGTNSLMYQMSSSLGMTSKVYDCPPAGHDLYLDNTGSTSGIEVTAIYHGNYYLLSNWVAPNTQNQKIAPGDNTGIDAIEGKSGVQIQITPTAAAEPSKHAFLCSGSFTFTTDMHIMAKWNSDADHACDIKALPSNN